jgi:hypothetical protein
MFALDLFLTATDDAVVILFHAREQAQAAQRLLCDAAEGVHSVRVRRVTKPITAL